ncbi:lipoate--protein ligase family protein [Paenibacillus thermotolerans]|uniref:lipoate--protein ligase family protein n=1 Tax=Paenibacillus thermotolerans TaxID=3027807 RepID=UPI002368626F|nr:MULTISPECIES: hypothetical protein [unclassified Paenibacillus]
MKLSLHLSYNSGMTTITHLRMPHSTDIYFPFAYEELLARSVGEGLLPGRLVHIWSHERAFVLGLRDSRLPHAAEAMDWLEREGYRVMVRNSGGAAVPLDLGVINVTLIQAGARGALDINGDFQAMAEWLRNSLEPLGVRFEAGEIAGAYCPGEYDLSIGGRKFCGIAQRRLLKAYSVQAFVNAEGRSKERAAVAREFYRRASGGASVSGTLTIDEEVMGSISELAPDFPGAEAWVNSMLAMENGGSKIPYPISEDTVTELMRQMKLRYDPRSR